MHDKKSIKLGNIKHAVFDFKKEILAINFEKTPDFISFFKIDTNFFKYRKPYLEVQMNLEIYD